ncbi:GGDEF domain-containing protein [Aquisalimonas sp.]|uniref:sensor domain-containing diguanylate cyclase n=1 Tax=Aquisalimonas sp. TaxID=1872621 RepID=UPI0025B8C9D0|nr:GGDEF domain-containing protein [Aquisalimonas sp.]
MTEPTDSKDLPDLLDAAARSQAETSHYLDAARERASESPPVADAAVLQVVADAVTMITQQTDTRGVLEHLVTAARRLIPDAEGVVLLSTDDHSAATTAAFWNKDTGWVEGSGCPVTMPKALKRLSRGDAKPDLRLPLEGNGIKLGECRLLLTEGSGPGTSATAQILLQTASLTLAGLQLQVSSRQRTVRDPLTGLFNRPYLLDTLQRELHHCRRAKRPLGLIQLALDGLRDFNARHGRAAGDRLLQAVAGLLQTAFRGSDAVCRTNGDTFVIILPEADLIDTRLRAEELRTLISTLELPVAEQTVRGVSASVGVAGFPEQAVSADALLLAVDGAVQLAREAGGDTVQVAQAG